MARAWLLVCVTACFGRVFGTGRGEMDGRAWASGDGSTYIYEHGGGLVSMRGGIRRELPRTCITDFVDRVFVSFDGRKAFALAWQGSGSWHSSRTSIRFACAVDVEANTTVTFAPSPDELDTSKLLENSKWIVGERTGWIYRLGIGGAISVYSAAAHKTVRIVDDEASECDVAEAAATVMVGCTRYRALAKPGDYAYFVTVSELDTSVFPPVKLRSRDLSIPRGDGIRFSRDGARFVWWSALAKEPTAIGVVEVAPWKELARFSTGIGRDVMRIAFSRTADRIAVAEDAPDYADQTDVAVFALSPAGPTKQAAASVPSKLHEVYWLDDAHLLVSGYGAATSIEVH